MSTNEARLREALKHCAYELHWSCHEGAMKDCENVHCKNAFAAQPQETAPAAFDALSWLKREFPDTWATFDKRHVEAVERAAGQAASEAQLNSILALCNEHLKGRRYADAEDAVRNLLQAYVTMKGNAEEEAAPATAQLSEDNHKWLAETRPMPDVVAVSPTVWGVRYSGRMICAPTIDEAVSVMRDALCQAAPGSAEEWQKVSLPHVMAPDAVTTAVPDAPTAGKGETDPIDALKSVLRVLGTFLIDEHSTEDVVRDTVRRGWRVANGGNWYDDRGDSSASMAQQASSARPSGTSAGEEGKP